jgi:hypothetical protein
MGQHGPVPERSGSTLGHRSKAELDKVTRVRIPTKVSQPRAKAHWEDITKQLYESLKISGQAKWFEPSDWAFALFTMEEINDYVKPWYDKNGAGKPADDRSRPSSSFHGD